MLFRKREYTEEELIDGCLRNDRRCQEALYRMFFPKMMSMVMRYAQDEERGMEILNNGFLRVFKKLGQYEGLGSFEGWIRRIVYHAISDYYRKESRYLKFIVLDEKDRDVPTDALDQLYYDDIIQLVEALPEKSREVFKLHAIEGYTHEEIGNMLGISDGTSKWHLSNARAQLKKSISKRYKSSYAG